jgi:hypothetical protein
VIASDARRHRTGGQNLPHRLFDPLLRVDDVEGIDVDIPAVRHAHLGEGFRAQHRVIRPDQKRVVPDLLRPEPRPRPEAHRAVERNSEDRHVEAAHVPRVREPHER